MNIGELLAEARLLLAESAAGRLESEVLLGHVLGVSRAHLYANPASATSTRHRAQFLQLVERRQQGEPIAYLTGQREFWSLPLKITPDVLIPRPETELLVEAALARIPADAPWRVADLGTGSGAIAIAIAWMRKRCEVHATEISAAALAVAMENAETIVPGRIQFHRGSWLSPLQGPFQFIVSNPPYVETGDPHLQQGDIPYEPVTALSPGHDGLAAIRHIAADSLPLLDNQGWLAMEHGFEQGKKVRKIMQELGYSGVNTLKDLADLERVSLGRKP
jgi:release factor glutamine methyltransferase